MKIECAVLAAGSSARMEGQNKLVQSFNGRSVIGTVISHLHDAGIDRQWLVYGDRWGLEGFELPSSVNTLRNPDAEQGIGSSIALVVRKLSADTDCLLLVLGDMPLIQSETIRALLAFSTQSEANIWAPVYQGRRGHPVIFDKCWFTSLSHLKGDQGGAMLFRHAQAKVACLEVDDPGVLLDIDTPGDLRKLSEDK